MSRCFKIAIAKFFFSIFVSGILKNHFRLCENHIALEIEWTEPFCLAVIFLLQMPHVKQKDRALFLRQIIALQKFASVYKPQCDHINRFVTTWVTFHTILVFFRENSTVVTFLKVTTNYVYFI